MRVALAVAAMVLAPPVSAQQTSGSIEVGSMFQGNKTITPDWAAINGHPLGTPENPVRVHGPLGQMAYLSRLICTGGGAPSFTSMGMHGMGPYGTIIDGYTVTCGSATQRVFLDKYHVMDYVERRPVPGFTIRDP